MKIWHVAASITAGIAIGAAGFRAVAPATAPVVVAHCSLVNRLLPDPVCTPGVTNPNVSQGNIKDTICKPGWTRTVRPSVGYTDNLKRQQMKEYGFKDDIRLHEEDHLIPLELGGNPHDPHNLWPEPGSSPNAKDKVENELNQLVCSGQMTLADAQQRIAKDWTQAVPH